MLNKNRKKKTLEVVAHYQGRTFKPLEAKMSDSSLDKNGNKGKKGLIANHAIILNWFNGSRHHGQIRILLEEPKESRQIDGTVQKNKKDLFVINFAGQDTKTLNKINNLLDGLGIELLTCEYKEMNENKIVQYICRFSE